MIEREGCWALTWVSVIFSPGLHFSNAARSSETSSSPLPSVSISSKIFLSFSLSLMCIPKTSCSAARAKEEEAEREYASRANAHEGGNEGGEAATWQHFATCASAADYNATPPLPLACGRSPPWPYCAVGVTAARLGDAAAFKVAHLAQRGDRASLAVARAHTPRSRDFRRCRVVAFFTSSFFASFEAVILPAMLDIMLNWSARPRAIDAKQRESEGERERVREGDREIGQRVSGSRTATLLRRLRRALRARRSCLGSLLPSVAAAVQGMSPLDSSRSAAAVWQCASGRVGVLTHLAGWARPALEAAVEVSHCPPLLRSPAPPSASPSAPRSGRPLLLPAHLLRPLRRWPRPHPECSRWKRRLPS